MPTSTALVLAADAAPAAPAGGEGGGASSMFSSLLPLVLIFLIFYMLLIRPQSRERKKREEQLKTVRKHDRVITNAGIHGTVVALGDTDVTLRVDDHNNVRLRVERSALWQIRSRADDEGSEPETPAADRSKEKDKATG